MALMFNTRRAASDPQIQAEMDQASAPWPVLSLSWADRQRSRLAAMLPNGKAVAVILPRGEQMQHGDVLCGEAGERLWIKAAEEEVYKITTHNAFELMRVVYHLANRHVKAMLAVDAVYIEPDSVLAEMVRGLGAKVDVVQQAFLPEGGAYATGHVHGPHCNHGDHGEHGGHGHHHHGEDPALSAEDQARGNLGEQLSIAAHARK